MGPFHLSAPPRGVKPFPCFTCGTLGRRIGTKGAGGVRGYVEKWGTLIMWDADLWKLSVLIEMFFPPASLCCGMCGRLLMGMLFNGKLGIAKLLKPCSHYTILGVLNAATHPHPNRGESMILSTVKS